MILLVKCNKIATNRNLDDHSNQDRRRDVFVLAWKREATGILREKNFTPGAFCTEKVAPAGASLAFPADKA